MLHRQVDFQKTIYKLDSKGNVRYLKVTADYGELIQESGILGGSPVIHQKTCNPKNLGRANETTSSEQAVSEAESLIANKCKGEYFESEEEAKKNLVILPMLANSFKESILDWQNQIFIQPKLDGMRCLNFRDGTKISRKNRPIENVDHIQLISDEIIDGELYVHGESFQKNMQYIKKYRKGLTEKIGYHVYDLIDDELEFVDRYMKLKEIVKDVKHVHLVPTFRVFNINDINNYHKLFIKEGYEGSIIRLNEPYMVNKRSNNILKYKDFQDLALKIKSVVPTEARPEQGTFIFSWKGAKGHPLGDDILGCGMKFSHDERKEFLDNKDAYIGKTAEIRFFEYSDEGIPRFPVCVGLRLDK